MFFYFGRTVATFSDLQGVQQSGINSRCFILLRALRATIESARVRACIRLITGGLCDVNYDAIFSTLNINLSMEGAPGGIFTGFNLNLFNLLKRWFLK